MQSRFQDPSIETAFPNPEIEFWLSSRRSEFTIGVDSNDGEHLSHQYLGSTYGETPEEQMTGLVQELKTHLSPEASP